LADSAMSSVYSVQETLVVCKACIMNDCPMVLSVKNLPKLLVKETNQPNDLAGGEPLNL